MSSGTKVVYALASDRSNHQTGKQDILSQLSAVGCIYKKIRTQVARSQFHRSVHLSNNFNSETYLKHFLSFYFQFRSSQLFRETPWTLKASPARDLKNSLNFLNFESNIFSILNLKQVLKGLLLLSVSHNGNPHV